MAIPHFFVKIAQDYDQGCGNECPSGGHMSLSAFPQRSLSVPGKIRCDSVRGQICVGMAQEAEEASLIRYF